MPSHNPGHVALLDFVPIGYEDVTIDSTSGGVGLTSATYSDAKVALVTVEAAEMRFTFDGTAPTTTKGHLVEIGDVITLRSHPAIANFKGIRTGTTSATIRVTYMK